MTTTETAKMIRNELKKVFPKQKFSVRKRNVGAIDVSWQDGIAETRVKPILQKHEWFQRDEATQEILSGGNTFVFAGRKVSDANRKRVEKKIREQSGFSSAFSDFERENIIKRRIWEKLEETSFR